jgi:hypothetical protein
MGVGVGEGEVRYRTSFSSKKIAQVLVMWSTGTFRYIYYTLYVTLFPFVSQPMVLLIAKSVKQTKESG